MNVMIATAAEHGDLYNIFADFWWVLLLVAVLVSAR